MSTIEELLERKSSGSGRENRNYGHAKGGTNFADKQRSLGIVLSRTEATESVCPRNPNRKKFWYTICQNPLCG
jgi:hypothetical protein